MENNREVNIIGAGLAGCECALFLASKNIKVNLYEMKKIKKTPAQKSDLFAELVCSNSLKSTEPLSASGLLKLELKRLGCNLLQIAESCAVPSGTSLSVDREKFSQIITEKIYSNKNITVIDQVVKNFDINTPTVLATGPLCDDELFSFIKSLIGDDNCYFYDAIAPIVSLESVDMSRAFWGNRYEKGGKDYLNCWLDYDEYQTFIKELKDAKTVELHSFEKLKVFEGCMPVEVLAKRGDKSLRYGPMKPVGLSRQVKDGKPYAMVQLRKENSEGTALNMVGFQTNLIFSEQKRVFSLIPALKNAEFLRYGTMHRNSFINAPKCLNNYSQLKNYPNIFVAGQISGVEGYVESIASGLFVAQNMQRYLQGKPLKSISKNTCLGAIIDYITNKANENNFEPMNANYGIFVCDKTFTDKKLKKQYFLDRSMEQIEIYKKED